MKYRKKKKKAPVLISLFLAAWFFLAGAVTEVYAEEAYVHYGSAAYEHYVGEAFSIGLYIESEIPFEDYKLVLTYDPAIAEYVEGASEAEEGTITVSGNAGGENVRVMLQFNAITEGEFTFHLTEAYAVTAEGEELEFYGQDIAPLSVKIAEPAFLDSIAVNGERIDGFQPEVLEYALTVPYEIYSLEIEVTGGEAEISDTALQVGNNRITLITANAAGEETVYTLQVTRKEESLLAPENPQESLVPENPQESLVPENPQEPAQTKTEEMQAEQTQTEPPESAGDPSLPEVVIPSEKEEETGGFIRGLLKQDIVVIPLILVIILILGSSCLITYFEYLRDSEKDTDRGKEEDAGQEELLDFDEEYEEYGDGTEYDDNAVYEAYGEETEYYEAGAEPVISVQDVCMDFKIATRNVSGIKEWLIEKIKGKISYRKLSALQNVSFDVYEGEVVGIIGTNGSGKSTILKIISGALAPTRGEVFVDRSKIQLLTLGTGFDMELTARENVYLNGAIIGYTRQFIEEHYASIVKFAELEGFMEEKVKNFSSGMVSRLGFAIATAGDTAEILILDEVLSVGDEFFRQKSLRRVKEMIHGGSTVLMVSHSMSTIRENCSKVVWIEKGRLQMTGSPKEVCEAYSKQERV